MQFTRMVRFGQVNRVPPVGLDPYALSSLARFGKSHRDGAFVQLRADGSPPYQVKMSSSTRCIERAARLEGQGQRYPLESARESLRMTRK